MNDYYMMMCDIESDEKSIDDPYWFVDDDEWLNYSYDEEIDNSDWEEF